MAFRFYIDGQLTDQPVNDTALSTSIVRDNVTGGITITQDVQLQYNNRNDLASGTVSGYTILKTAFEAGTCDELDIDIYDETSASDSILIFKGVIKVPSLSIDEHDVIANTTVEDNSWYSYINNNKNIKYNVQSTKTKNGLPITPPPIYEVDCFESNTGVYGSVIGAYFRGYRVYDVFKYLVAAISDNKVGFESYYLQNEPQMFIFDGSALINENTNPNVLVSYSSLYEEMNKINRLGYFIDNTDPNLPVLRIEDIDSLYSGVNNLTFDDVLELKASVKSNNIYSSIRVGADRNPGGPLPNIFTFNAGTSYFGWKEELYTPLGQCNSDNELNLMNEFGITSNDVHHQLRGAASTDLEHLFLIECENIDSIGLTADAVQYTSWVGGSAFYYNQGTNNPSKLLNHNSSFQSIATNTLEIGGNGFQASLGQDAVIGSGDPNSAFYVGGAGAFINPVVFADETSGSNYDGGGNYFNITGIYVAPADGAYSFNSEIITNAINIKTCSLFDGAGIQVNLAPQSSSVQIGFNPTDIIRGFVTYIYISVFTDNTLSSLISSKVITRNFAQNHYNWAHSISSSVNLLTGNAVIVSILTRGEAYAPAFFGNTGILHGINPLPGWDISIQGCDIGTNDPKPTLYALENSTFKCTGSPDGGGIQYGNDPALYKTKVYEFNYEITQSDFEIVKANPTGLFTFEKDGIIRTGWIDTIKRNDWTGQTQIKLITNNATT